MSEMECLPDCDPGGNSEDHRVHGSHDRCATCPYHDVSARLRGYVREYVEEMWPDLPVPPVSDEDVLTIEVRSDGWANAHVEGEHEANGLCQFTSARECGERMSAAEFVECG